MAGAPARAAGPARSADKFATARVVAGRRTATGASRLTWPVTAEEVGAQERRVARCARGAARFRAMAVARGRPERRRARAWERGGAGVSLRRSAQSTSRSPLVEKQRRYAVVRAGSQAIADEPPPDHLTGVGSWHGAP